MKTRSHVLLRGSASRLGGRVAERLIFPIQSAR